MQLQPGVLELFQFLGESGIKRALVTRNAQLPTDAFLKKLREELDSKKDNYPSLNSGNLFSKVVKLISVFSRQEVNLHWGNIVNFAYLSYNEN